MVNLFNCQRTGDDCLSLQELFDSGALASGQYIRVLEREFEREHAGRTAVAMSNLTDAIRLTLLMYKVIAGDEVIVVSYNCLSSTGPLSMLGLRAVWLDFDPDTMAIDLNHVRGLITDSTKGVIIYHIAGYPVLTEDLANLCRDHGLFLFEDCNNCYGGDVAGVGVGGSGDVAFFSFYANRQVNGIDGAMVLFRDRKLGDRARSLRRLGIDVSKFRDVNGEISDSCEVDDIGVYAAMTNVNALLTLRSLRDYSNRAAASARIVQTYDEAFSQIKCIRPIRNDIARRSANWVYLLRSEHRANYERELRLAGVQTSRLHRPNHLYQCFAGDVPNLPGTDEAYATYMAIPCGWWLSDDDVELIISTVTRIT